jgi:thiamine-monophosphate kinase
MGPGGEFDLIRRLLRGWGERAVGIGDDAALLRIPDGDSLVATTDTAVEGVHFRFDWSAPDEIGYRAATAAMSDLAAMAARPIGILVALTIPERALAEVEEVARGIGDAVAAVHTAIVGGNVSSGPELSITTTALGHVRSPLLRSAARAGQTVYVTGRFGGPALAVQAWQAGRQPNEGYRARYARPAARIAEAQWLVAQGATAGIDISDGLLADLEHMVHASGVSMDIDLDPLPLVDGAERVQAARGGDEYELAVTAPPNLDTQTFADRFGIPLTAIGVVREGEPAVHATCGGERVAPGGGWSHFS